MDYHFDPEKAKKYGVDEAIMLYNLVFWIRHNKANAKGFRDGRTWTYNTLDAYSILFPFWNRDKVFRIIKSLVDQKVIRKGNFNEKAYDKTCWYALEDESLLQIRNVDIADSQCRSSENAMPIPDIKPDEYSVSPFHPREEGEEEKIHELASSVPWRKERKIGKDAAAGTD